MDKMSSAVSKYVYWILVINYTIHIHVRFNRCVDFFWGVRRNPTSQSLLLPYKGELVINITRRNVGRKPEYG